MSGLPPETAERFEKVIMHRVDSSAADALNKLLSGDGTPWTAKPRSAWTRFLVSMLLRAPERLSLLKEFIKDASAPGTQQSRELYEAEKKPGDISFEEFLLKHSDQAAFQTVTLLLNNVRIGEGINKMIW